MTEGNGFRKLFLFFLSSPACRSALDAPTRSRCPPAACAASPRRSHSAPARSFAARESGASPGASATDRIPCGPSTAPSGSVAPPLQNRNSDGSNTLDSIPCSMMQRQPVDLFPHVRRTRAHEYPSLLDLQADHERSSRTDSLLAHDRLLRAAFPERPFKGSASTTTMMPVKRESSIPPAPY